MKILVTEQQLKTINEISDRIREQIDIIYQDKNLICFVPKTQETSKIYGHGANWCQRHKNGFEMWSEKGLLIRFLFRGGRKIRTTYFFKKEQEPGQKYYWANENGYHVLFGGTSNPFDAVNKEGRIKGTEQDIINYINIIPDECKKRVLDFIQKHEKGYEYCYRDTDYKTKSELIKKNIINKLKQKYSYWINEINKLWFVDIYIDQDDKYSMTYSDENLDLKGVHTNDPEEFNSKIYQILKDLMDKKDEVFK